MTPEEMHEVPAGISPITASGIVPTTPTLIPFPFPLTPGPTTYPCGCAEDCEFPIHLSNECIVTLRTFHVPDGVIREALADELGRHAHGRLSGLRRSGPATLSDRAVKVLSGLGVPDAAIEAAREMLNGRSASQKGHRARSAQSRAEQIKAWKEANKARVAAHSRSYRQRKKGTPVE